MKITDAVSRYVEHRRSLGEKCQTNAIVLGAFSRSLGPCADESSLTPEKCHDFLYGTTGKVTPGWFVRHSALKGFFAWMIAHGQMADNPLPREMPRRVEHMRPYIYSKDELRRLFAAAGSPLKGLGGCSPECMQTILKLTYALGLRISETMALTVHDVDLARRVALIRDSKFHKTRVVTFNEGVSDMIAGFMRWRASCGMPERDETPLFLRRDGKPVRRTSVNGLFCIVRKAAGISRSDGAPHQPRLHDLRHTFAVNRLTSWYREGRDVQSLLPSLSTYLGHQNLAHTAVYLTMTPTLLGEANARFLAYAGRSRERNAK